MPKRICLGTFAVFALFVVGAFFAEPASSAKDCLAYAAFARNLPSDETLFVGKPVGAASSFVVRAKRLGWIPAGAKVTYLGSGQGRGGSVYLVTEQSGAQFTYKIFTRNSWDAKDLRATRLTEDLRRYQMLRKALAGQSGEAPGFSLVEMRQLGDHEMRLEYAAGRALIDVLNDERTPGEVRRSLKAHHLEALGALR